MEQRAFEQLKQLIYSESGIVLSEQKKSLLQNRIQKRLRTLNLSGAYDYVQLIESDNSGVELGHLIDAISTNHTYFFREEQHFEFLKEVLEKKKQEGKTKKLRIWCAAASSGEEPFSIAITAAEQFAQHSVDVKLLATDICVPVLKKASLAIYNEERLSNVSDILRSKYFDTIHINNERHFRVKKTLTDNVLFKRLNLSQFPYPLTEALDIIFCRNVMIYFDDDLRVRLINEFYRLLRPGGYLFVGHSESLSRLSHKFSRVQASVYKKQNESEIK